MLRYLAILIFAILLGCKPAPEERIIDVNPITLTAEEQEFISKHRVVTWALENNRPPAVWVDDKGEIRGRVPAYLSLISKKTGLVFRPVPVVTLAEALAAVENGQIDLVTNVRPTAERLNVYGFTPPFAENPAVFLFPSKETPNSPLRAGIQKGDSALPYIECRFPGITIVETDGHEESMTLLSRGVLDVIMLNEASADFLGRKFNTKFRKVNTDFIYYASIGFRKDELILGSILSKAMLSISAEDKQYINDAWKREKD